MHWEMRISEILILNLRDFFLCIYSVALSLNFRIFSKNKCCFCFWRSILMHSIIFSLFFNNEKFSRNINLVPR